MEFRIAGTFTASLGKLTAEERKVAKTTAFDTADGRVAVGTVCRSTAGR